MVGFLFFSFRLQFEGPLKTYIRIPHPHTRIPALVTQESVVYFEWFSQQSVHLLRQSYAFPHKARGNSSNSELRRGQVDEIYE